MFKLKRRSQFQKVYKKGRSLRSENIALCLLGNNLDHNRIGVSVNTKGRMYSVKRNRCRRLLYESFRLSTDSLKSGHDLVLIAKKDISTSCLENVMNESVKLYKRAGILA